MVRLLAMGHAARGLGTGDFQGELDTRLVPKLCPGCQGVGALLAERCCPVVPVVCPRALVGAGAAPCPQPNNIGFGGSTCLENGIFFAI